MTRQKNEKGDLILQMIIKRRINDAIDFRIIFLPLRHLLKFKSMSKLEKILNWTITLLTGLTVLIQYILAHLPKALVLVFVVSSVSAQSLRVYPCTSDIVITKTSNSHLSIAIVSIPKSIVDSTFFLAPSVNFELFTHELNSGITEFGAIPGIGYGLKWNPYKWKSAYLLGIDLFTNAGIFKPNNSEPAKYFNIECIPVLTLLGYLHIGFGYRWKLGLNGNSNEFTRILVTGVSVPLP
jgi:hypothetical protein